MKSLLKDTKGNPTRWNVLLLAQMITSRTMEIMTPDLAEYRALDALMDDDMVNVAIKMGVRKPKTFSEIQEKTGRNPADLEKILDRILIAGIGEFSFENPQHEKQYFIDIPVSGSSELSVTNDWQRENIPEVGEYFEICSRDPVGPVAHMVAPGGSGVGMHVIPVEKAIECENQTEDVEHISYWLDKYDHFAFWPCQCRLIRQHNGLNTGDDPEGWCIGLGDFADYLVETNRGVYATREEVDETLQRADHQGFVHQVTNIDGQNKVFILCNCNVNSCLALRTSQLFNTPNMSRSAYTARVEPENCVACGKCVEHCPAGAVKLGQKLSTEKGPVEYPKHILPDDHVWGKKYWDESYRDTNRINCYPTGTAPCKTACPAHIAIQGYLQLAKEGRYDEALELIKMDNPFPAVCGRICNRRCEDACTRGLVDKPLAIDEVKNFLAQRDLDAGSHYIPEKYIPKVHGEFDEKIAVIGGGPAGLSCAYYLAVKGYRPTVFERNECAGGMMVYGIPSFKLEKDVVAAEIDILKELGVEIRTNVDVGKDVTLQQLRDQGYKAFYLAIGCQGSRKANIPGEDADGILSAVDHLRRIGDGSKGYTVSGKTVVVGGGNVAIDAARTAARIGASEVSMYCLEPRDAMPAAEDEIMEAESENITIHCGWGPKEFIKEDNGHVKAVVFKKCTQVKNAEGRFDPQYDENNTITVEADYVVTSIGQCIDWGNLLGDDKNKLEYVHGNYPKADPYSYQTSVPDIFVGGDVYSGPKFVIDAIAAGHMASEVIHRYVRNGDLNAGRDLRQFIELDKNIVVLPPDQYDRPARQQHGINTSIHTAGSFHDPRLVFTEEQVKLETSRCLSCGAAIVDENKCIGCGVCTNQCKFDAIHLHRTHPEATNMYTYEDRMKSILPYTAKRYGKILKRAVKDKFGTSF